MVLRGISKSLKFEILDTTELVKEVFERVGTNLIYSERIAKMTTFAFVLVLAIILCSAPSVFNVILERVLLDLIS